MILSLGWSCAGIEPVLQGCGRICPSPCRVCSSADVESVLQRVVRQFLRRVLRQCLSDFSTSALHSLEKWPDSVLLCCQQPQNWFLHQLVWLSSMSGSASAKSAVLN